MSRAIKTIKEDCKSACEEYTKHYKEVTEKIIEPLKELLVKQSRQRDRLEEEQKVVSKKVQEAKIEANNKHTAYIEAYKTFDIAMTAYEEKTTKRATEEPNTKKNNEEAQSIVGLLKKCKETEKSYVSCINNSKVLLAEASISNVLCLSIIV